MIAIKHCQVFIFFILVLPFFVFSFWVHFFIHFCKKSSFFVAQCQNIVRGKKATNRKKCFKKQVRVLQDHQAQLAPQYFDNWKVKTQQLQLNVKVPFLSASGIFLLMNWKSKTESVPVDFHQVRNPNRDADLFKKLTVFLFNSV